MNLNDVVWAAQQALHLLALAPGQWLLALLLFLGVVESLMFVPRVGFVLKLWVASVAQVALLWLAAALAAGRPPALDFAMAAFRLPLATQAALAFGPLLAFAMGLLVLRWQAGAGAVGFFFGRVWRDRPPAPADFLRFKAVIHLVGLPFVFVPGVVALAGTGGLAALGQGLVLAGAHPWALLAVGAFGLALEAAMSRLPGWMPARLPRPALGVLIGVLLLAYLGFSFTWLYVLSALALPS